MLLLSLLLRHSLVGRSRRIIFGGSELAVARDGRKRAAAKNLTKQNPTS